MPDPLPPPPAGPPPGRVLVVDDDPPLRLLVGRILAGAGHTADEAGGVDEALALAAGGAYDVALVDLDLHGRTGLDFLDALPGTGSTAVPVLMTGTTDVGAAVGGMKRGAFDYLAKPFRPDALRWAVGRALGVARARRRERVLERVAADWQATFDACPDLLVVLDPAGRVVRLNAAAAGRAGAGRAGQSVADLFPGGVGAAAAGPGPAPVFDPVLGGHFLVSSSPIPAPGGPPVGAVVVARDVSALARAEEAVRAREAHSRAILATARDTILTLDDRGLVESLNPAGEAVFGYAEADVVGHDAGRLIDPPAGGWAAGGPCRELLGRRRDGTRFPAEASFGEVNTGGRRRFVGVLRDITARKHDDDLRARLFRRVVTAQEEERARVARELHDGIGQALASLAVGLAAVPDGAVTPEVRPRVRRLRQVAAEAVGEVRRVARRLRPTVLDDLGLVAAVSRLAETFTQLHGVRAELIPPDLGDDRLPPEVESAVYRVVQEALANVAKHARARVVDVVLERVGRTVRAAVIDDGVGLPPDPRPGGLGLGLIDMRERAAAVGGTLRVESAPGRGTTVGIEIPIPEGGS